MGKLCLLELYAFFYRLILNFSEESAENSSRPRSCFFQSGENVRQNE